METTLEKPGIARVRPIKPAMQEITEQRVAVGVESVLADREAAIAAHNIFLAGSREKENAARDLQQPLSDAIQQHRLGAEKIMRGKEQQRAILTVKTEAQSVLAGVWGDDRYVGRAVAFLRPAQDLAGIETSLIAFAEWLKAREAEQVALEKTIRDLLHDGRQHLAFLLPAALLHLTK